MLDLVYVISTFAFFAMMLGYVRLCERLGRPVLPSDAAPDTRA